MPAATPRRRAGAAQLRLDLGASRVREVRLGPGAVVLEGFALSLAPALLADVQAVAARAPFRHLSTPGGLRMSVAMTNCGELGWISDARGYRYAAADPQSGEPWPALPGSFAELAARAARRAGFAGFVPDACLVNRYTAGTKLSLHRDADERDLEAPIVSVSLGLPAVFLFGGLQRNEPKERVPLEHGDVVVWGGPDRLRYHGVAAVRPGTHALTGEWRYNLTLRKAG